MPENLFTSLHLCTLLAAGLLCNSVLKFAHATTSQNITLLQDWKKADAQLYRISLKETELTNQKVDLDLALNETIENIKYLSNLVADKRNYIIGRIRYINQDSGSDFLRNLVESSNPGELDRNMKFYLAAVQSDVGLIQFYNKDLLKLESEKRKYSQRLAKLNELKLAIKNQFDSHIRELNKKNDLLNKIKSKLKTNAIQWKRELESAIKSNDKDKIQFYRSLLNKNILDKKGQLLNPTDFDVKYGYGMIKFSPASPALPFHGVLYNSPVGAPVKAIADGTIVWIGLIDGLGDTVILDHGQEIHSLYSRVTLANLHIGEMIEEGMEFSKVNKSTFLMDSGLYFELRDHGRPTNPLRWMANERDPLLKNSNAQEKMQ